MSADAQNLLLLFQRPLEPSFFPKDNGKTSVNLPSNFYSDRYRPISQGLQSRFGEVATKVVDAINVQLPDLRFAEAISKTAGFSLFSPVHQKISGQLISIFINQPNAKSLFSVAAYARDRLNPYLFQYAYSVAVAHREDTKHLPIPSAVEKFPDLFVDPGVFPRLGEEGKLPQESRQTIEIPRNYTATDREDEQRLAYFREDIGVNLHHWHWHLVYPAEGPDVIVKKDRRGELFYYMHGQCIARYNVERFCNKLATVKSMLNFRDTIPEAYFPKLIRSSSQRAYPPRFANSVLRDMNRAEAVVTVAELEIWRDRLLEAIDAGYVMDARGTRIPLTAQTGIDIIGNLLEASSASINPKYYGNMHNLGHFVVAFAHDPDGRYLEDFAPMGDVATAMRDPYFYKWHGMVDWIHRKFQDTLPEYTPQEIGYNGVTINSINVTISRGNNSQPNKLLTFWQKSAVDLNAGLDFGTGNVLASFTHLQHAPFNYEISVNNSGSSRQGTCRIFIAPKKDERGVDLTYNQQRIYVIELDKFTVTLNPGENRILRRSDQSSVTIAYDKTFRRVGASDMPTEKNARENFQFCGCGWPQHMLLPKGTPEGMQFDLFVMISNYSNDLVDQPYDENINCNDAVSFCGLRGRKYPDKRTMGFPFDRKNAAPTLASFVNRNTNMKTNMVTIKFTDTVVDKF